MALLESNMLPLGTKAPDFTLLNTVDHHYMSLAQISQHAKATLVMFLCNHCPYVVHINSELVRLANDYLPKSIAFVAISSNDIHRYPDDAPEKMREKALELAYPFPYLYDDSQAVARAYDAACTPDFYIFDANLRLVYRGRLDDSRPKTDTPLTGRDIRAALDALLKGEPVAEKQYPSMGCSIKWK